MLTARCCSGVVWAAADVCKKCVAMINFTFHLLLIRRFLSRQKHALLIIGLLNGTFTLAPTFEPNPLRCWGLLMLPLALPGRGRRLEYLKTCELDAYLHHHCNIIMHLTSTKCNFYSWALSCISQSLSSWGWILSGYQCPLMWRPIRTTVEKNASKSAT